MSISPFESDHIFEPKGKKENETKNKKQKAKPCRFGLPIFSCFFSWVGGGKVKIKTVCVTYNVDVECFIHFRFLGGEEEGEGGGKEEFLGAQ